ncbi:unnamed protein product, partial [Iphiclides podalirius]
MILSQETLSGTEYRFSFDECVFCCYNVLIALARPTGSRRTYFENNAVKPAAGGRAAARLSHSPEINASNVGGDAESAIVGVGRHSAFREQMGERFTSGPWAHGGVAAREHHWLGARVRAVAARRGRASRVRVFASSAAWRVLRRARGAVLAGGVALQTRRRRRGRAGAPPHSPPRPRTRR